MAILMSLPIVQNVGSQVSWLSVVMTSLDYNRKQ